MAASEFADGYLASRFKLPLASWGTDLRIAVASVAAWTTLCMRGFNPDSPGDSVIRQRRDDAEKWLDKVSRGSIVPGIVDSTPTTQEAGPRVSSGALRGW